MPARPTQPLRHAQSIAICAGARWITLDGKLTQADSQASSQSTDHAD